MKKQQEEKKQPKKNKPVFRKLFVVFSSVISVLLFFFVFIFIYFIVNKNEIAEKVLLSLNENSSGEVVFQDISLYPFIQFPSISLALEDVEYYETPKETRDSIEKPIGRFETAYAAVDIIDLLSNEISVSNFILEDGEINIVKYLNKSFNLKNALKVKKKPSIGISSEKKPVKKKSVKPKNKPTKKKPIISKELKISLEKISLKNIKISYDNRKNKKEHAIFVLKLDASFSIMPDSFQIELNTDMEIEQLELSKKMNFTDHSLHLETDFNFDRNDSIIKLKPSKLSISDIDLKFDGMADFKGDGIIDLNIDGSDKDVSFFSLVLTELGSENIKKGDFYFKSTIKGSLKEELPAIECDFGLSDFSMKVPNTLESIKDLNIHGYFKSGNKLDLSEASLNIDTLNAKLPGGYILGVVKLDNFAEPRIKYNLDMKLAIDGFENVFKLGVMDSLKGTISLSDEFEGSFKPDSGWTVDKKDNLILDFDSVSFRIPDAMFGATINGRLVNGEDKLYFDSIEIKTGNTDFLINGDISNVSNFIFDQGKEIIADLQIESNVLDLPELLSYYPLVRENFPYRMTGINLDVQATTKASNFKEFNRTPKINFNIKHLDASIDSLLTPVTVNSGVFILTELKSNLFLDFKNLDISLAGSKLNGDFKYYSPKKDADSLETNVKAKDLNLGKVFYPDPKDSIPFILNALLYGSFDLKLVMQKKLGEKFNKIEFNTGIFSYASHRDTVNMDSLRFTAMNIFYDTKKDPNPLATLSGDADIFAGELSTSYLKLKDVLYKTKAQNGIYTIIPENDNLFGVPVQGKFVISPFDDPPSYQLKYSVKQFRIDQLLTNLLKDKVLVGPMDFSFELTSSGNNKDTIFKNMNGKIHVKAKDLLFYGLDIDKFIKKYERSQNFSLLDIGAVLFAGPIGLAVTKGTDYARIVITDHGESTDIIRLVSDWEIESGKLIIDDVAFTTNNNRLAMKGLYDINNDSLDLHFAVLNEEGCSVVSQSFSGSIMKPKLGKLEVVKSLFAPITNIVDKTFDKKCDPFYNGSVPHPEKTEND